MTEELQLILAEFALEGTAVECSPFGRGHINRTFLVRTDRQKRYILQKINNDVFCDVNALMENVCSVSSYLRQRADDARTVLTLVAKKSGGYWSERPSGFWRVYHYVENSICLQAPESPADFYEVAVGFGRFQQLLAEYPANTLHEVIPNFHNTPDRYRLFHNALNADVLGRASEVQREIDFVLEREQEMSLLQSLRDNGTLPTRVTHNDTKLNNVLLDAETRKALCVIDLDTVMPGLSLYDYGDSIRFGAATAAEDERDLSVVGIDKELFRVFTRGYVHACPDLTKEELALLVTGAKTITLECGLRFLTDYLDGDRYFAVHRAGHNLDRARTQFKLVQEMEAARNELEAIVGEECGQ